MKLGQNLFRKDQSIWGKPIIEYDQSRMNELFSQIRHTEDNEQTTVLPEAQRQGISLETELYLMIHA